MGGFTRALPTEDRNLEKQEETNLRHGWYAWWSCAEEIMFDDITSGASSDIERVTKIARSMVTRPRHERKTRPDWYTDKRKSWFSWDEKSRTARLFRSSRLRKLTARYSVCVNEAYKTAKESSRPQR